MKNTNFALSVALKNCSWFFYAFFYAKKEKNLHKIIYDNENWSRLINLEDEIYF